MQKQFEYDVFLSYASQDEDIARPLWEKLTLAGVKVFWADTALKDSYGESWYSSLEESLEKSRHMILLWTEEAQKSRFVRREYQAFDSEFAEPPGRALIPVLAEGISEKSLPIFLRRIQSFSLGAENELTRIIAKIRGGEEALIAENNRLRKELESYKKEVQTLKKKRGHSDGIQEETIVRPGAKPVHLPSIIAGAMCTLVLVLLFFQAPRFFKKEDPWSGWPDEVNNILGLELVLIEPGVFEMGNEAIDASRPVREVRISEPFYMGRYEVTAGQWEVLIDTIPNANNRGRQHPVENISWEEAQDFIAKLNVIDSAYNYRLPTEAEWEYAARAGRPTPYYWGDDPDEMDRYAHCDGSTSHKEPGSHAPNRWGLYDMLGNVFEWTADWYGPYNPNETADPQGPESGEHRVLRGGSFGNDEDNCRVDYRHRFRTSTIEKGEYAGFRVVATPKTSVNF